jgi:acetyl esterase/lipase
LAFIPLILVLILLFAVIWIVLPALNRHLWLLSIGIGEWSLWFGALALLSIVAASFIRLSGGDARLWIATLAVGAAVILLSLYPLFSILLLSLKHKIPLSLRRYFAAWPAKDYFVGYEPSGFTTRVFGTVDGNDLRVDVYLPTVENQNNGASVMVVHGGSWHSGARRDFPRWNDWLAAQGFTVFDIDYRLAPQPNYLTAVIDIKSAVRWVKGHAEEFAIDPDRVALLGRSAGAHLALLAAYTAAEKSESVRAAISFYGPIDLLWAYDIRGNPKVHDGPGSLQNFLGGRPEDSEQIRERYRRASPINHIGEYTPPTLMTHGGRDRLVWWKNMYRLGEKLQSADVPYEIIFVPYGQHGFDYNINGWGSQVLSARVREFLQAHTASASKNSS